MKERDRKTSAVIDNKKLPTIGKSKNHNEKICTLNNAVKSRAKTERSGNAIQPFSMEKLGSYRNADIQEGKSLLTKKINKTESIKNKEEAKVASQDSEYIKVMEFAQLVDENNQMERIEKEGAELKQILSEQRESLQRFRESIDLGLGRDTKLETQLSLDSTTRKIVPKEKIDKLKIKLSDLQIENSSLQALNLLLESNGTELKRSVNILKEGWRRDRFAYKKHLASIRNLVDRELSQISDKINNAIVSVEQRLDKIRNSKCV